MLHFQDSAVTEPTETDGCVEDRPRLFSIVPSFYCRTPIHVPARSTLLGEAWSRQKMTWKSYAPVTIDEVAAIQQSGSAHYITQGETSTCRQIVEDSAIVDGEIGVGLIHVRIRSISKAHTSPP